MGDADHHPVDRHRTTQPYAGESMKDTVQMPGLVLIGAGVIAFVISLANFALSQVAVGVAAVIVALLSAGAGAAWLATERRRVRQAERDPLSHGR